MGGGKREGLSWGVEKRWGLVGPEGLPVGLRGWRPFPNAGGWGRRPQAPAQVSRTVRLCPDAARAGLGSSRLRSSWCGRDRVPPPPSPPNRPLEESEGSRPHKLWEAKRPESGSGRRRALPTRWGRGGRGHQRVMGGGGAGPRQRAELPGRTGPKAVNHRPPPVVGAGSQIQLLTQCIIITANSPLKRNYHQYDISRQQGTRRRERAYSPIVPLMGTSAGEAGALLQRRHPFPLPAGPEARAWDWD